MPDTTSVLRQETDTLLEKMSTEKREYLLWRLVSEKLATEQSSEPIPVRRPDDGTVVGYLRRLTPPTDQEQAIMNDRARRIDLSAGRSTRDILERMTAANFESVKKFIH